MYIKVGGGGLGGCNRAKRKKHFYTLPKGGANFFEHPLGGSETVIVSDISIYPIPFKSK